MADMWYFAQADLEFGPFSAARMKELAAAGSLLRSAAVWKEGMTKRVAASKVDKLFPDARLPSRKAVVPAVLPCPAAEQAAIRFSPPPPALIAAAPPDPTAPDASVEPPVPKGLGAPPVMKEGLDLRPEGQVVPIPSPAASWTEQVRKKRVVGVKGAVVMSQDGVVVSFRKKCVKCQFEDPSRSTMPIRNGPMRVHFFCPKCRKAQQVEMQGVPS